MCFNPSTHGVKDFAKGCLVLKYLHKAFSKFFLVPGGGASSNIYTPYGIDRWSLLENQATVSALTTA